MTILKADSEDVSSILELERKRIGESLGLEEVSESILGEGYICLVAKEETQLIGYVLASIAPPEAEIYSIAVDETYEGHGIGKKLIQALEVELKKLGIDQVLLEVEEGNSRALRLYSGAGFVEYRRRKGYYGIHDAICMRKEI